MKKFLLFGTLITALLFSFVMIACDQQEKTPSEATISEAVVEKEESNVIVITFTDSVASSKLEGWTVTIGGKPITLQGKCDGLGTDTWEIGLARNVEQGEVVKISYDSKKGKAKQNGNGGNGPLKDITDYEVTNNVKQPVIKGAYVLNSNPSELVLLFSEKVKNDKSDPEKNPYSLEGATPVDEAPDGFDKLTDTWKVKLTAPVTEGKNLRISYNGRNISQEEQIFITTDEYGNKLKPFSGRLVANRVGKAADATVPTLKSAHTVKLQGNLYLGVLFSEPVFSVSGAGWTVTGAAYAQGEGSDPQGVNGDARN